MSFDILSSYRFSGNVSAGFHCHCRPVILNLSWHSSKCFLSHFCLFWFFTFFSTTWISSTLVKVSIHMGVHRGRQYRHLPPLEIGSQNKKFQKTEVSNITPVTWFNSCNDSLFAVVTFTLHKSQDHWSGVMQWRDCSSLMSAPLPAEAGCETCEQIIVLLVFIVA